MASSLLQSSQDWLLTVAVLISSVFTLVLLSLPSRYVQEQHHKEQGLSRDGKIATSNPSRNHVSVQIVVLGDIGRSPRMQYHAISLAKHGAKVDMIGYQESDMHPDMFSPNISVTPIPPSPAILQTSNKLLFLITAPLKVIWQILSLYYVLGYRTKPAKWMLVQNPPSIPTLAIASIICFLRGTKLTIDWHNFGYSILALKLGPTHPVVRISKQYEIFCGRFATAHFTVTNAMANVLKSTFGVSAIPLHDRPPAHFQPLDAKARATTLQRLVETTDETDHVLSGKTRLIVSATSWTADEDFSILLDALIAYSERRKREHKLPAILAIITGKGPQKQHYLDRIQQLQDDKKLDGITIKTAWLTMEDYAALLGAADLGISLHTSSSGVDLPMKVVDMFGTGLPVLGWSEFPAWKELVTEDVNGKGFGSSEKLSNLLEEVLGGDGEKLQSLRQGALKECDKRWDDTWNPVAGRLFDVVSSEVQ